MQTDGELESQYVKPRAKAGLRASVIDPLPVLACWQGITGSTLSERHREEFLNRPATSVLAEQPSDVLHLAGHRLWQRRGRLDLLAWVLEADWPGLPDMAVHAADLVTSPS